MSSGSTFKGRLQRLVMMVESVSDVSGKGHTKHLLRAAKLPHDRGSAQSGLDQFSGGLQEGHSSPLSQPSTPSLRRTDPEGGFHGLSPDGFHEAFLASSSSSSSLPQTNTESGKERGGGGHGDIQGHRGDHVSSPPPGADNEPLDEARAHGGLRVPTHGAFSQGHHGSPRLPADQDSFVREEVALGPLQEVFRGPHASPFLQTTVGSLVRQGGAGVRVQPVSIELGVQGAFGPQPISIEVGPYGAFGPQPISIGVAPYGVQGHHGPIDDAGIVTPAVHHFSPGVFAPQPLYPGARATGPVQPQFGHEEGVQPLYPGARATGPVQPQFGHEEGVQPPVPRSACYGAYSAPGQ
ncbi:uncharacterized protein [Panulirus ornatus]|uniref:uncharacterized protein n=1 Tax=Panulirus ornatus TaxID=150431 RepID=UPI003A886433